jgi:hypothetical protein
MREPADVAQKILELPHRDAFTAVLSARSFIGNVTEISGSPLMVLDRSSCLVGPLEDEISISCARAVSLRSKPKGEARLLRWTKK